MIKRAVIFDFGGVIFKTRDYTPRHQWDERLGKPHGTVESIVHGSTSWKLAQTGEISVRQYWESIANQLGIDTETAETELAKDFYSGDRVDEAVLDVIRIVRDEGHTVALLSNDSADLLIPRMEQHQLMSYFNPIVISSEIGVMKPHPKAYAAVLEQLERPAEETIFIDDMRLNIESANEQGIHGIHYIDGMELMVKLRPLLLKL